MALGGRDRLDFRAVKLQKLAGYGPTSAFVSAGSLLVFLFILIFGYSIQKAAPVLGFPIDILWLLALWLWLGALAVVVFDLEWLEHPATSTRWFQVAHWATLAAVVLSVLLGIAVLTDSGTLGTIAVSLLALCVGLSLLVHNIDARRAGLLHGVLPWIGIVTGIACLLVAVTIFAGLGLTFIALLLGHVFYIAWAIWIGVNLRGSKPAGAAAPG
jgi:hypothetical protein